jgi:hypothetical protein
MPTQETRDWHGRFLPGHPGGPGREPTLGDVTERFQVRCTPAEKALWKRLAETEGLPLSHFGRRVMRTGKRAADVPRHLVEAARASAMHDVSERFPLRCTPEERARWEERAHRDLLTLSRYARKVMRERTGLT